MARANKIPCTQELRVKLVCFSSTDIVLRSGHVTDTLRTCVCVTNVETTVEPTPIGWL